MQGDLQSLYRIPIYQSSLRKSEDLAFSPKVSDTTYLLQPFEVLCHYYT
jgi:hypothetical protein